MEQSTLITTIKAMKTALASGIGGSKADMALAIKIAFGFAENTLSKLNEDEEDQGTITHLEIYDDLAPDSICGTEDGI